MKQFPNNTAILVFANSSSVDEVRKRLPNSQRLFGTLTNDILEKVKKTNLPYFLYDENLQIGSNFGARFTTAIQSVFAKGFENIITVGNDTPNLTLGALMRSYEELQQGKTVVGPSTDGGVYLLGFHKNRFDPIRFRELPWQKRDLYEKIALSFLRMGVLHQLPRLTDVDTLADIKKIINTANTLSSDLAQLMLHMLRNQTSKQKFVADTNHSTYHTHLFNKGSPKQASL